MFYSPAEQELCPNQMVLLHDAYQKARVKQLEVQRHGWRWHKTCQKTRTHIVVWLMEIQVRLKLSNETLHRAIHLFDQYNLRNDIESMEQWNPPSLVALTSLYTSAKVHECVAYDLDHFQFFANNGCTKEQVGKSNHHHNQLLSKTNWDNYIVNAL